jgi:PQQ-dependent catabolism-associated CXXCW motif protein
MLAAALAVAGVASAQAPSAALPFLNTDAKSRIDQGYFAEGKQHKALALTEAGEWHYVLAQPGLDQAIAGALRECQQRNPRHPCFIAAENDQVVVQSRYTPAAIEQAAFEMLKRAALSQNYYADEERDAGVAPTRAFRTREVHAPTPRTVPDAKTISTRELVEMLKTSKPLLVNVLDWKEGAFAIPGTLWVQGLGKQLGTKETAALQSLLAEVAPDKKTPVALYCLSWECWMSYNASLTMQQLGYTNVYWYRGGVFSWNLAGLPIVRARLHKQL